MLLQASGRLSTREIAERLEISHRTAHRDMEALCQAGVPLIAYRGATGGWELQKGWRTRVPGLDDAELQALLMTQPSALGDRKLTAAARRAFDKLMASMPTAMRLQADSIRARLHIDPTGWRPATDSDADTSMLPLVQEALARDCKLTFLYTRADGETAPRTVDPLGIVCKQSVWYLVAQSPAGMRTYRLSRMRDVVPLALTFTRPANFDLATYWNQSTTTFTDRREPPFTATLALSPQSVQIINRWCTLTPIPDHPATPSLAQNWQVYKVQFETHQQALFTALGLGSQSITLAPDTLRKEITEDQQSSLQLWSQL